jgi:hypothetical protein
LQPQKGHGTIGPIEGDSVTTAQLIELLRDLAIIGFVGFASLALLVFLVISILLYRKIAPTLDSARGTVQEAERLTKDIANRLVKPAVEKSAFANNAGQVIGFLLGLTRRKRG